MQYESWRERACNRDTAEYIERTWGDLKEDTKRSWLGDGGRSWNASGFFTGLIPAHTAVSKQLE